MTFTPPVALIGLKLITRHVNWSDEQRADRWEVGPSHRRTPAQQVNCCCCSSRGKWVTLSGSAPVTRLPVRDRYKTDWRGQRAKRTRGGGLIWKGGERRSQIYSFSKTSSAWTLTPPCGAARRESKIKVRKASQRHEKKPIKNKNQRTHLHRAPGRISTLSPVTVRVLRRSSAHTTSLNDLHDSRGSR